MDELNLKNVEKISKYKNMKFITGLICNNNFNLSHIKNNIPTNTFLYTKGNITADPFIYEYNNETYLFYEHMDSKIRRKGEICVCKIIFENNKFYTTDDKTILKQNHHLSYPHVFDDNNNYYLIPESNSINKINLYKFTSFPYELKFEKTLLNIPGKDTNLIYHNNMYFLFTYVNKTECIYYSKNLYDTWIKHNYECKYDKTPDSGRNAGKFFFTNGEIYRPKQLNINYYGEKIQIFKIITLNINCFEEILVDTIDNIHHLTFTDKFVVYDFYYK